MNYEILQGCTSLEECLLAFKDFDFDKDDYKKQLEYIDSEILKYRGSEYFAYYAFRFIILIKNKLIEISKENDAYLFKRDILDNMYKGIVDGKFQFDYESEIAFMTEIMTATTQDSLSKDFLSLLQTYKIEKFVVPFYLILDEDAEVYINFSYEFLLQYGLQIKNLMENKSLKNEIIFDIYIRYLLACAQNMGFYENDEYNYNIKILNLLLEIEDMFKSAEKNVLFYDLITISKYYIASAYYSEKKSYEEDFEDEIDDTYWKKVENLNKIISKINYEEAKLHSKIKSFFNKVKQEFLKKHNDLIDLAFEYFMNQWVCYDYEAIDTFLKLKKNELPIYKSYFLIDFIIKNSCISDLYNRKEYKLIAKKYDDGLITEYELKNYCFKIAYSFHEINELDKATKLYKQHIQLGKADASTYNNLGCIYSDQGNEEKALEYYKIAHKMNPENDKYINNINIVEKKISSSNSNSEINSILWENVDEKYVNGHLKHLEMYQIKELLKRYYNNEKVSTLIQDYNLKIKAHEFYRILPPIVYDDKFCYYCKEPMITYRPSKSDFNVRSLFRLDIQCPKCHHVFNTDNCNCETCKILQEERKKVENIEKRKLIRETYSIDKLQPRKYEDLSIYEKLYLSAIVREGLEEDMKKIKPINDFSRSISPTDEHTSTVLDLLVNNILYPHPNSDISAFSNKENFPNTFYTYKVHYHINLISEKYNQNELFENVLNPKKEDTKADIHTYYNLWVEIALEECKQYLLYNMDSVGFNFNIGDKTTAVFKDLLNNFSVGQIYYIIYKGVTDATRLYQEKRITKKHAANTVITNCRNYGERVVANSWEINPYKRIAKLPQTLVSECFFNRFLNIAEKGFYEKPSLDFIREIFDLNC